MNRMPVLVSSLVLSLAASSLSASVARASDVPPQNTALAQPSGPSAAPTPPDVSTLNDGGPRFRHVAITANPLSLALRRIGLNVEYLPVEHHAIVANPYYQSLSLGADSSQVTYTNIGGELGYHYYTGHKGANGFFLGPSLTLASVSQSSTVAGASTSSSILSYGAAFDIGGQHVFDNGITIGGGIGAMYLIASQAASQTSSTFKVEGVLPRFLLTLGYSI